MVRRFTLASCGIAAVLVTGSLLAQSSSSPSIDCSDPTNPLCQAAQTSGAQSLPSIQLPRSQTEAPRQDTGREIYVDSGGFQQQGTKAQSLEQQQRANFPPDPLTDFQRLARQSTGQLLPIFGRELFRTPPSTFAPADQVAVLPDYVVGPGDEIVVRTWGHNNFNGRLTVDRTGAIYIPQVGSAHVAGLRFSELQPQLKQELSRTYRNFDLSVNMGQLRSIQVFVLGEARRPGTYTVSALSTAFNALLVSGGPTVQGSLRNVEIRRGGQTVATMDLYDFVLRGDRSKDLPLQAGDVVFIPFVGPQVALAGSVRHPAIYEVKDGATVASLLQLAGGLDATAAGARLSIERIEDRRDRHAMSVALDAAGMATTLADGDVLHADSVLSGYSDSVTIRGNLANAGRFPWHPGMKLSDIIPDRASLLTNDYWRERNRLGLPTPLFQSLTSQELELLSGRSGNGRPGSPSQTPELAQQSPADAASGSPASASPAGVESLDPASQQLANRYLQESQGATGNSREPMQGAQQQISRSSLAEQQQSAIDHNFATNGRPIEIKKPAPEIDWSYAVIERLDPKTLKNSLVPFNLGRLVENHDSTQDLPLQPGDVVTILSQSDVHVRQDEQTKYVRLEGEFVSSGVYSVQPNETLEDLVRRAGGLTDKAYLFGSSFTRESARVLQQQRLDEYVSSLAMQMERASSTRALSSTNPLAASGELSDERVLLDQLRKMRATGRVVLEFKPNDTGIATLPTISLEDGDVFRVPSRPLIVSVVGSVYGQNVFLYNQQRRVRDYLALAGKPNRIADRRHAFIIRADGSVDSKDTSRGLWSDRFESSPIFPGDTVVVPEKPIRPNALRDVIDWSQVFSQFAIGAAAIRVIQ